MAGAGVVRRGAAFQRWGLQAFHHQQPEPWVQGMQKRCQGGTHDPGTHQHSVVSIHSTESPSPSVWINLDGRMPTLGENVLIPAMSSETMPLTSENVEKVLDELRPFLMADGGNVEVVEIDGPVVKVRLQGACGSCPSSTMTLKMGIERKMRESIPEVSEVVQVL